MGLNFRRVKSLEKQKKRELMIIEYEITINEFKQGCERIDEFGRFSEVDIKTKYIMFAKSIYKNISADIEKLDKERRIAQAKIFNAKKADEAKEEIKDIFTTKGKLLKLQEKLSEIVKKYTGESFGDEKSNGPKQPGEDQ